MRAVNIGVPFVPPFAIGGIAEIGQSLSIGQESTAFSTTQPYRNKKLFDSLGATNPALGYNIANPQAPTLSLVPLVAPQRPSGGAFPFQYPVNIISDHGPSESPEVFMSNEITRFALLAGYIDYPIVASCVGCTGQNLAQITKGGTGNAYAAALYEVMACASGAGNGGLAAAAGFATYGVLALSIEHGETDALTQMAPGTYLAGIYNMRAFFDADCKAITKQARGIPAIVSQQNADPFSFEGINTTALSQAMMVGFSPDLIVSGPKYQETYNPADRVHLLDYRRVAGKKAQAFWGNELRRRGLGPGWTPLYILSVSRSGQTVTVNLNIPVGDFTRAGGAGPRASLGPLAWDSRQGPHGVGTPWAMWGPGNGFEVYDCQRTPTAASGTPIVVTLNAALPAGFASGMSYAFETCQGNTAMNSVWIVDVVDSTHLSLRGSASNGTFQASGRGFAPVGIASATISGSQVLLGITRGLLEAGFVAYAHHADQAYNTSISAGGFPDGRCGLLRDSDPYMVAGTANQSFCLEDEKAVA